MNELRFEFGPGYRVYFVHKGHLVIILLAGGDKRSQGADIRRAQKRARDIDEER